MHEVATQVEVIIVFIFWNYYKCVQSRNWRLEGKVG